MLQWIREKFQKIFIPQDEGLRLEFALFRDNLAKYIGDQTTVGVDAAFTPDHNTILIVMSRLPAGDIVKHVAFKVKNQREIMDLLRFMRREYGINDQRMFFDGTPGYTHFMRNELDNDQ